MTASLINLIQGSFLNQRWRQIKFNQPINLNTAHNKVIKIVFILYKWSGHVKKCFPADILVIDLCKGQTSGCNFKNQPYIKLNQPCIKLKQPYIEKILLPDGII